MRVAVNLLWLVPGVVGGTETYATGLLRGLSERDVDLTLFVLPQFAAAHPDLASSCRTVVAPLPPGRHVVRRVGLEQTWLAANLRRIRPDAVHHFGGVVPAGTARNSVLTLHDLQYRHYPGYFSRAKRWYLAGVTRSSLRRARVVTTPSRFTMDDIQSWLALPPGRTEVIPPRLSAPPLANAGVAPAWPHPYVLYPAATYPHKNHRVLIDALKRVSGQLPDLQLVFTGASGAGEWGSAVDCRAAVEEAASRAGLSQRVHWMGWLSRQDYQALLAGARALVFPSEFEGYGLPVVEAMSAGVPVLAGDAAALPELVGRGEGAGGELLSTLDAGGWAKAIERVVTQEDWRDRLATAATRRFGVLQAADPVADLLRVYSLAAS